MDRPEKRARAAAETPSLIPPAPVPRWEEVEFDVPNGDKAVKFVATFDEDEVLHWVDRVEGLLMDHVITWDELAAVEQEHFEKHHLDLPDETPEFGTISWYRKWLERTYKHTMYPGAAHMAQHNTQEANRNRRHELEHAYAPLHSRVETEHLLRETRVPELMPRQFNPDQRFMHIYYPPGGDPFASHRGRDVARPAAGIVNEHIDVGAGVRKLI